MQHNKFMKTIIQQTKDFTVFHHTGMSSFGGCQCYKDCTCKEDFTSAPYDYYTVKKGFNKPKTTRHETYEGVEKRIAILLAVPIEIRKYHT